MTIEEKVMKDPEGFKAALEETTPAVQEALKEMSSKFDAIFGNVIRSYCESAQVESNVADIPSYKTVNKLITGKIDEIVKEYIKEKRKDIV